MLQFKPIHLDFKWETTSDGYIDIEVPKFKSNFGKSFCKIIKKENIFIAHLDAIGSLVWKHSTGEYSVQYILDMLLKEFPKEEDLDQRLFLFLTQMKSLNYLDY